MERRRADADVAGVGACAGSCADRPGADRATRFYVLHARGRAHNPGDTGSGAEVEGHAPVQFRGKVPLVLHAGIKEGHSAERTERVAAAGGAGTVARRLEREGLHEGGDDPQARSSAARTGAGRWIHTQSRFVLLYLLQRADRKWRVGLAL